MLLFRYAMSVGAKHFHTSAKLNKGIEEMFLELTRLMIEHAAEKEIAKAGILNRSGSLRRNVVVVDDEEAVPEPTSKFSCCS